MEPFYFANAGRELLGIYHPPLAAVRDGVVLCAPLFAEYLRSHGCLRRLALALAERGHPVLRFDYAGTGDSRGEFESTTPAEWQADIRGAAEELQALSGAGRLCLLGVRLGATLAARAALELPSVERVVLWDPVVSGGAYLQQLRATQRRLLQVHTGLMAEYANGADAELMGFRVSAAMLEALEGTDLPEWGTLTERPKLTAAVVLSSEDFGYADMLTGAKRHGVPVKHVAFDCNWTTHTETILFPHDIIAALTEEI